MNVPASRAIESSNSHVGTPYGIRASMTIGDVNGIIEPQNTIWLSGARNAYNAMKNASISGTVTGICSWLVSASFSTADPMAANNDE